MVLTCLLNNCREDGNRRFISTTSRTGLAPFHKRVVNEGSSNHAVLVPTKTAAASPRHLCTSRLENSLLISNRSPPASPAIFPLAVCAHFKIIYGRCSL